MKRLIKFKLLALIILTFVPVSAFSQANDSAKKRAEELLFKARESIGGDAKINTIKTLSLTGKFQRDITSNEVEFDFLFPDKFIRREIIKTPLGAATMISALEGETTWYNTISPNEMIRFESVSQNDADARKSVFQADAARWIFGLLLRMPGWSSMEFIHAGEAEVDEKPVDLIDIDGADGFQARLFLDKSSYRLAMVSYTGKLAINKRKETKTDENGNVEESENVSNGSNNGMKREVHMRFSDYRVVDGIQIPHRVVFQSGTGIKEDWELMKVQINTALDPEVFRKKVKEKVI